MSDSKLTPWLKIGEHGQPTRKGWYDARYPAGSISSTRYYWDGVVWRRSPDGDITGFGNHGIYLYDAWRGLAEKP